MHKRQPALLRPRCRRRKAVLQRVSAEVHQRAQRLAALDLGERRLDRHEHLARHATRPRRIGERPGVVACAAGHDTALAALCQRCQLVQRAAQLERARALQILGLQQHPRAAALRQRLGLQHRSTTRHRVHRGTRACDIGCVNDALRRPTSRRHSPKPHPRDLARRPPGKASPDRPRLMYFRARRRPRSRRRARVDASNGGRRR